MRRPLPLRLYLVRTLLVVLLPIVAAGGWLHYHSAQRAAEQFANQLADEISARVRERIVAFFDIPQRVVAFNVEQARAGMLRLAEPDVLTHQFLLQIAQEPQLTFVSMGFADGRYLAGSRPPLGPDRQPRILRAKRDDSGAMEVFRVDAQGRPGERLSRSEVGFDARARPWYESALTRDGMSWYEPYRYRIDDAQGAYAAVGMGVSAPVKSADGTLIGVLTADVALSQIGDFLRQVAHESGGVAFLADARNALLATSVAGAALGDTLVDLQRLDQSRDPILRAVGAEIQQAATTDGRRFIEVSGQRHLARWWTHALPQGPVLTVGVVLPEQRFNGPLHGVLQNIVYLTLAIMLGSVLLSLGLANRVVRPLAALVDWAARLTRGDWQAEAPASRSIRELTAVSDAMRYMADHLKAHSDQLEHVVAQRTAALEEALRAVEMTLKEQRQFVAMLSHEVRSPLAVIHAAAQVLASRLGDAPAHRSVVDRVLRGSARLNTFFDNCLTQDRIDSGSFMLQPTSVDVGELVAAVIDGSVQLGSERAVELAVEDDLPALHGDPLLLRIMLSNLLVNAFKYSPPASTVRLRVRRQENGCRFDVENDGPGIPPDEVALLFAKYWRGRMAEGKPGAGLGLSLVQRIAALHGGAAWYENGTPQGARFVARIPFAAADAIA